MHLNTTHNEKPKKQMCKNSKIQEKNNNTTIESMQIFWKKTRKKYKFTFIYEFIDIILMDLLSHYQTVWRRGKQTKKKMCITWKMEKINKFSNARRENSVRQHFAFRNVDKKRNRLMGKNAHALEKIFCNRHNTEFWNLSDKSLNAIPETSTHEFVNAAKLLFWVQCLETP
jgi:hypothetical protein